eukprot:TRINITY_DN44535_c0_g1_i1.p1 TRINITY_DN44535_c0_g1~~TRINITY_DN44535_c0_g1_i1.p1  ORF type:complete len:336 (+),score=71.33 TRINITY_DN44535_c0_g1_i1:87-1010(+)
MYSFYNPSKLPVVGDMLRDAKGQEPALLRALVEMYGPEPSGGYLGLGYRERLGRFYSKYNRDKLSEVDALLYAYKGREEELFSALVGKYGPEPSPVPADPIDFRLINGNLRVRRTKQIYGLQNIQNMAFLFLRKRYFLKWVMFLNEPRKHSFNAYNTSTALVPKPVDGYHPSGGSFANYPSVSSAGGNVIVVHHHHHHGAKKHHSKGGYTSQPKVHVHAVPYGDPWEWVSSSQQPPVSYSRHSPPKKRKGKKKKKSKRRYSSESGTSDDGSPRRMLKREEKDELVAEVMRRLMQASLDGRQQYRSLR